MRKIIKYSNGSEVITEGIEVIVHGATKVSEEDLSHLTEDDFKNLKDNPKEYKLKKGKVKKV